MHKMELGKADTFPDQSAAPSTEGKVVALNTLRIPFSGYDSTLGYVLFICVCIIGIDRINTKRRQQGSQLVQVFMFARTKTVGQWFAGTMVYCPPQPILL